MTFQPSEQTRSNYCYANQYVTKYGIFSAFGMHGRFMVWEWETRNVAFIRQYRVCLVAGLAMAPLGQNLGVWLPVLSLELGYNKPGVPR